MAATVVTPTETPDPFKGNSTTVEEYELWRTKGELPERLKPVETVEQKTEPPATEKVETAEGQEPSKTEQEKPEHEPERDEKGKFKAAEFTPEQQATFDRAFRRKEAKLRREYEERIAALEAQGKAPGKEPEAAENLEPKRPEPPKLADYPGTIEEYQKEVDEYPAKLQGYLEAQRQFNDRQNTIKTRLANSEKAAIKAHPDYQEKFDELRSEIQNGEEIGLPDHVLKAIGEDADDPYELTYQLLSDRKEYQRFTSLKSEKEALREVLKFESRLQSAKQTPAPQKKAETKAPPPPDPVGARPVVSAFDVNDEKLSADEWREKREQQLAAKHRR